jgi:hypothetical protein
MGEKLRDATRSLMESHALAFLMRALTLIGAPILLGWGSWVTSAVVANGSKVAVIEAQRVQGRAEIFARLDRIEASDTRDRERFEAMGQRIASVDATTQAILREIEALRRETVLSRGR